MFIVQNYHLAVLLCVVTMLCWGSWGNTQKLASKSWRYELFYWDYVIGILLLSLLLGLTMGSCGSEGRSFLADLRQIEWTTALNAMIGGIVFNAANILLSAAVALAGMSVAFPVGVGLALVVGVCINYLAMPKGDPTLLFAGVALVVVAIILNGVAAGKMPRSGENGKSGKTGLVLAVISGILMSMFYRFVAAAMDLEHFEQPEAGLATPYTAFFLFAAGILISNLLFNTLAMKHPFAGPALSYKDYFQGRFQTHLVGVLGGVVWGVGTLFSYIAAGKAGAAISYALGQGAPMIAALWGILVWHEFRGGPKSNTARLTLMILFFLAGLGLIVYAGI